MDIPKYHFYSIITTKGKKNIIIICFALNSFFVQYYQLEGLHCQIGLKVFYMVNKYFRKL